MYKLFMRKVLLIYGPTSAGKSQLALELAQAAGGVIINADSLQVYRELSLLSARPAGVALLGHHLYGHRSAGDAYSVGDWLSEALATIHATDKLPIVVGGTGLYFHSLTKGLSPIPETPAAVRRELQKLPLETLRDRLTTADPKLAASLAPSDRQRHQRALEVYVATGKPLSQWQAQPREKPAGLAFIKTALCPPREELTERALARLDLILEQGVLSEVAAVEALNLPSFHSARKALGYQEFAAHLQGKLTLDEALAQAKQRTRHYIRRQLTWARTQMADYQHFPSHAAAQSAILNLIKN